MLGALLYLQTKLLYLKEGKYKCFSEIERYSVLKNYLRAACAAASLAIGTRKGEQDT